MKTITLTDEAYQRLKEWKKDGKDSFSSIVLRVVPKRGTLADMLENFKELPPLTDQQAKTMTEAASWANDWKNYRDPWTDVDATGTQS